MGVEPMIFQNTGWTLLSLSYGKLVVSKVIYEILIVL